MDEGQGPTPFMGSSQTVHRLSLGCFTEGDPPKFAVVNAKGGLPNALVEPDGLLRTRSAPREPGVAGGMGWYGVVWVVWGGMGWYTTSAAATRAQRASCMRTRTECALPPLERHRGAMRVPPPNAQVSERAKACRARRTR